MKIFKDLKPLAAAHRLKDVRSCQMIHGHTYQIRVTVHGSEDTDMVLDFSFFGEFDRFARWAMDHRMVLDYADPLVNTLEEHLDGEDYDLFLIPGPPTVENLARYFWYAFRAVGLHDALGHSVQVTESPGAGAVYGGQEPEDQAFKHDAEEMVKGFRQWFHPEDPPD